MIKLSKNDQAFVEFVKAECKRVGVKCNLKNTTHVKSDGVQCSGYFDEDDRKLVVAMDNQDSLGVLVHEYCHLTQWEENTELWKLASKSLPKLFHWLEGFPVRTAYKHIAIVRQMELDNERRSVKMIKKWKLNIDLDEYVKEANAYIHFYNWLPYTRRWLSPNNAPYGNESIKNLMSTKFNMRYDKMSQRVFNAFQAAKI